MLQNEDIAKVTEIKGKFDTIWLSSAYLQSYLNVLDFNKIKSRFSWCKKASFSFGDLIAALLVSPLIGVSSINRFTINKDKELITSGKDSYYRILVNKKINWRAFLGQFVKQYLLKDELFTPAVNPTKCLIFDDTDLSKTGKTIEGISKIYNHVSKSYYLGFKLLVAGY